MFSKLIELNEKLTEKAGDVVRFALHAFIVMTIIGFILMYVISSSVKDHIIHEFAEGTAMTGNTTIAPQLRESDLKHPMSGKRLKDFDNLANTFILSRNIVRIKIWNKDGMVIYSDEKKLIGKKFEIEDDLEAAFGGKFFSEIKPLNKTENKYERVKYQELIEIYVPLYLNKSSKPSGAYEAYIKPTLISKEANEIKRDITLIVTLGLAFLYLTLVWFFKGAYDRVKKQTQKYNKLNIELEKTIANMEDNYFDTIKVLTLAVDAKDHYTAGHSIRVADISVAIAKDMGLGDKQTEIIERAALFHDIGKIGIPSDILNKPGKLTPEEWEEIKKHPVVGAKIIEAVKFLKPTVEILKHHHEHYGGGGYPDGLEKDEINISARIIGVADAFDAITTTRPHRFARSSKEALVEIAKNCGNQFDPVVAKRLIRLVKKGIISQSFQSSSNLDLTVKKIDFHKKHS